MNDSAVSIEPSALVTSAHKQERALLTRKHLIAAAREVFAKDGLEQARIEEIATKAGKTRGAFYANFDDKEDVFFAIFEEDMIRNQEKINPLLSKATNTAERIEALSSYFSEVIRDKQRALLYLEFKMYAIRHPRKRKRLAELHGAMCLRCCIASVEKLFPELAGASLAAKRRLSLQVSAALDGLALNLLFDPGTLEQEQLLAYLRMNLGQVMQAEVTNSSSSYNKLCSNNI